ncbi:MAG: CvpA family protein [Lachnospiraceae bacterium]|nr:CvpA family protein [Lachnospiraceae bacterium]
MNLMEIIVLIIFAAMVFDGGRIGFVKTIFSTLKMIIGILLAVVLCAALTGKISPEFRHVVPVVFIFVFGIVMGILGAVERLLNLVDKIPIAKQINRLAGFAAGVLKGIVMVWIIFCVVGYFTDTAFGQSVYKMLSSSKILVRINSFNPYWRVIELWWKTFYDSVIV